MRHLHLYLYLPEAPDMENQAALGSLAWLLARGQSRPALESMSQAFCQAQGIPRQMDWPIAPLTARASGLTPGQDFWLRLDPVFLDVGLRGPYLRGDLHLPPEDTHVLARLLTPLLAEPGFSLHPPGPSATDGAFHVRCPAPPDLQTTPLDQVTGRLPMAFLPRGKDAPLWARLLHEMQMLLHDHPLNLRRQDQGQAPVNSFWLWGGGLLPPPCHGLDRVWGRHPLLQQMARGTGVAVADCPPHAAEALQAPGQSGLVLLASTNAAPATWERDWFRPLARALRLGRLATLNLGIIGSPLPAGRLTPWAMWRFRA